MVLNDATAYEINVIPEGIGASVVVGGGVPQINGPASGTITRYDDQDKETVRPPEGDQPSDWAIEDVKAALAAGLVPESVANGGWLNPTSRLATADAIVLLIEKSTGKTIAQIASERGWDLDANTFEDTDSKAVTFLKYAGVTTGVSNNYYDPDGTYTRAMIVTMIGRVAREFFGETMQGDNPFTDVPDWAADYVGYAAEKGITRGVSADIFDSHGVLQNQQTAMFTYRAYLAWQ